jgi:hypothetical protein
MYVKLSWRPEVDENWAIMVVQSAILTYPTMVFYFWLAPQVLWNDLRGIVIKHRHWPMFWGIIHVDQATLRNGNYLLRSLNGMPGPWRIFRVIPHIGFSYFSGKLRAPEIKKSTYILSRYPCAHIYWDIWLFGPPWGPEGNENIGKSFYLNLQTLVLHYFLQSRGV